MLFWGLSFRSILKKYAILFNCVKQITAKSAVIVILWNLLHRSKTSTNCRLYRKLFLRSKKATVQQHLQLNVNIMYKKKCSQCHTKEVLSYNFLILSQRGFGILFDFVNSMHSILGNRVLMPIFSRIVSPRTFQGDQELEYEPIHESTVMVSAVMLIKQAICGSSCSYFALEARHTVQLVEEQPLEQIDKMI